MVDWIESLPVSQVPLAKDCRGIARLPQHLGKRHLACRQSVVTVHLGIGIDHTGNPRPLLVSSREQTGPGRATDRTTGVKVQKFQATRGQPVQVRRDIGRVSITTCVTVTHIVSHDHDQIGTGRSRHDHGSRNQHDQQAKEPRHRPHLVRLNHQLRMPRFTNYFFLLAPGFFFTRRPRTFHIGLGL